MIHSKYTGIVLDVARQRGGAEPSTTTLYDRSRYGNNGTMANVTWLQLASGLWVPVFNGTTSQIPLTADKSLHQTDNFTVECWFNLSSSVSAVGTILATGTFNADGWSFFYWHATPRIYLDTNQAAASQSTWATFAAYDTWTHLVVTLVVPNALIYLNGVDVTGAAGAHIAPLQNLTKTVNMGGNTLGTGERFYGDISMLRLYAYALNPAQIRARFTATRSLFGV